MPLFRPSELVNASEHKGTEVKQREFPMLCSLPKPRDASEKTLRGCDSEQEAVAVAIVLSRVSQAEIARRMGVAKSLVTMLKSGERLFGDTVAGDRLLAAFCAATGSNVVKQYRTLQAAYRDALGRARAIDRIRAIARYSEAA